MIDIFFRFVSFYQPIEFKDNLRTIEARFPKNLRTTEAHFEFAGPLKKKCIPKKHRKPFKTTKISWRKSE